MQWMQLIQKMQRIWGEEALKTQSSTDAIKEKVTSAGGDQEDNTPPGNASINNEVNFEVQGVPKNNVWMELRA